MLSSAHVASTSLMKNSTRQQADGCLQTCAEAESISCFVVHPTWFERSTGFKIHLNEVFEAYYTEHKMTKMSTLDFLKDLQQTMDSSTPTIVMLWMATIHPSTQFLWSILYIKYLHNSWNINLEKKLTIYCIILSSTRKPLKFDVTNQNIPIFYSGTFSYCQWNPPSVQKVAAQVALPVPLPFTKSPPWPFV